MRIFYTKNLMIMSPTSHKLRGLLLFNTMVEGLVGLLFVLEPSFLGNFAEVNDLSLYLTRMYGFTALSLSLLSLLVYRRDDSKEALSLALLTLTVFHFGISLSQWLAPWEVLSRLGPTLFHGIFGGCFLYFYFRTQS